MRAAAAMLLVFALGAGSSAAETPIVFGAGGGLLYVDKQAATPVTGPSGLGELSVGARLAPRSTIKVRFLGFRADGNNGVIALGGELDLLGPYLGVTAAAGFSRGAESRGGNFVGLGGFGRGPIGEVFAVRLDAAANAVARNDFSGVGFSLLVGIEVTWDR